MRLHVRLIALLLVVAGLIGVVLALTVLNTDEESSPSPPGSEAEVTTGASGSTDESTTDQAQSIPIPIDGPLLGVNLTAYTADGYSQPSVRAALNTLAGLGSTAVTLVPTWYMESATGDSIKPEKEKTPTDRSLETAIDWARMAGLHVILKPHVDVIDDSYRGNIQPVDRPKWFRSYQRFINHYADLATRKSVSLMAVGTELKTLSSDTEPWREVISSVRERFNGPLTYAANWDELDQVQFWDELDAIGVDAYYPLSQEGGNTPTLPELVSAWDGIADQLEAKSQQWQRPVLLTEVGYPSQVGATVKPYEVTDQPADQNIQALAYRATFKALSGSTWLEGISWWSWRADPSPEENLEVDYPPEGKKAQGVLRQGQWMFEG